MSGMRQGWASIVAVCVAAGTLPAQEITAAAVLTRSRAALGLEAPASVTSIRMLGTSTRVLGALRLGGAVDLRLALPDRYLRVDVLALPGALPGTRGETATGFNRDTPIQRAIRPAGQPVDVTTFVSAEAREQTLRSAADLVRHDLRLLLLGFFADSFDSSPLTAKHLGIAEAPDGRAYGLALTFANGSEAILFVDTTTHLPRMVTWNGPDVVSAARAAGQTSGTGQPSMPHADVRAHLDTLVEHRWYFGDYRPVGRFRWPFVLRHAVAGSLVEELRFDQVMVNPVFEASVFDRER